MRQGIFSLAAALVLTALHGTGHGQASASKRTARVKIEMSVKGEAVPSSFIASLENNRGNRAGGTGVFRLDDKGLFYRITVNDLSGVVTQAHFHDEAASGEVIRAIAFEGNMAAGTWKADEAAQPLTPALREALQAGRIYVDIHTAAIPGGELRGQVTPASGGAFLTSLEGGQEFAAPASLTPAGRRHRAQGGPRGFSRGVQGYL